MQPGALQAWVATMLSASPAPSRPELSWLSLTRVLWKRRRSLLLIWLLASVAAATIVSRLPSVYRAEALVLVEGQRIPEKYVAATVNDDLHGRLSAISQQILSYARLLNVIETFDLYREQRQDLAEEELVENMRQDIEIELVRGWEERRAGAFRVAYHGSDQTLVAQVANRLANLFIDENMRAREVQAEGTSEFLDQQAAEAKGKLEQLEAQLSAYKGRLVGQLPQQEGALISSVASLRTRLESIEDATHRAEQRKMLIESSLDGARSSRTSAEERVAASNLAEHSSGNDTTTSGADRLGTLRTQLRELRSRYSEQHPDVKTARAELARQEGLPAPQSPAQQSPAQPSSAQPSVAERPLPQVLSAQLTAGPTRAEHVGQARERVASLESQRALMEEQMSSLTQERKQTLSRLATVQSSIEKLPLREQELAALTRDYEISRAYYQSLLDKKLAAGLATEMERRQKAERFVLLDMARAPTKPISPNRPLWTVAGSLLALLLAAAWSFGREFQNNVILGEWELPPEIPVLGRIPPLTPAESSNGAASFGWPRR